MHQKINHKIEWMSYEKPHFYVSYENGFVLDILTLNIVQLEVACATNSSFCNVVNLFHGGFRFMKDLVRGSTMKQGSPVSLAHLSHSLPNTTSPMQNM